MGGWFTSSSSLTPNNNDTVIIAERITYGNEYRFLTRLPGVQATDMICTLNMSKIIASQQAFNSTETALFSSFQFVEKTKTTPAQWILNNTFVYPTFWPDRNLHLAMSADNTRYAISQANITVELRKVADDTLVQSIGLANVTQGFPLETLALDYTAQRLIISAQGDVFPGERYLYAIEYSPITAQFDTSAAVTLVDPSDPSYLTRGAGSLLSFVPNSTLNTLVIGLPSYPITPTLSLNELQSGALSTFIPCVISVLVKDTVVTFTKWYPGYSYFLPFFSGLSLNDGLGSSYTSHNVWSADGTVLIGSAPFGTTGRVMLYTNVMPACPIPPQSPPQEPDPNLSLRIAAIVILVVSLVVLAVGGIVYCIL